MNGFDSAAKSLASSSISQIKGNNEENGCIKAASRIYDGLVQKGFQPNLVIVKKAPGGFENWCYNVPCYKNYHQWHESSFKTGLLGMGGHQKYCVGIRM